jgi:putative hydrolase of HD superfamily
LGVCETGELREAGLMSDTIRQQFAFLAEIDRLKTVMRQSPLLDRSRKENSAEHSWHLTMFALTLVEHAGSGGGVDLFRVIRMLMLHDIVEIDAGDTPFFAKGIDQAKTEKAELHAAKRIFGLLPAEQGSAMLALWQEFEAAETPDARFAKALDRLQPLLVNTLTDGGTWNDFGVSEEEAVRRYGAIISKGSPALWREAQKLVALHFARQRQALASGKAPE